jgi:hypothetical protein
VEHHDVRAEGRVLPDQAEGQSLQAGGGPPPAIRSDRSRTTPWAWIDSASARVSRTGSDSSSIVRLVSSLALAASVSRSNCVVAAVNSGLAASSRCSRKSSNGSFFRFAGADAGVGAGRGRPGAAARIAPRTSRRTGLGSRRVIGVRRGCELLMTC